VNFYARLNESWEASNSLLCVGLDPDFDRLPDCVKQEDEPVFTFNKAIIDATAEFACAYKPQIAYYNAIGAEHELKKTIDYISTNYSHVTIILDAKRGDIGNTARRYADEAYNRYKAHAVTVNPYMGGDTLDPFLKNADKGVVILCRTSNAGAAELQGLLVENEPLYIHVARLAAEKWNYNKNICLVIGATAPEELKKIRTLLPEMPFLVPGVGAQGGDLKAVLDNGLFQNKKGLLINSSRGIIFASSGEDFAEAAGREAKKLRDEINSNR